MNRYRLARAATAAVLVLTIAACGGPSSSPSGSGEDDTELVFWHYFTDREELLQQFADEYEAETGVSIDLVLVPGDTLGQKFQAAAQAGTLPDISAAWAGVGEETAPYAREGQIADLSAEMADGWSDRFEPSLLAAASFPEGNGFDVPPGPYLVPLDSTNMQILYNKQMFADAGITELPTTWDDFIAAGRQLAEAGFEPFTAGFGQWPLSSFAQVYQWNVIGEEDLKATFAGTMPYTAEPWVRMLGLFEELGQAGILADGTVTNDAPASESLFVNGQAAMLFDGSWALGVFKQQNPSFTDYGVFVPPSAGDHPVRLPGGVGAMVFAVGSSPHRDEAVEFLQWLTDTERQRTYATESLNLPANTDAVDDGLDENLAAFAAQGDAVAPTLPTPMPLEVDTTMTKGIQRILQGQDTPEGVAALMQKAAETGQAQ